MTMYSDPFNKKCVRVLRINRLAKILMKCKVKHNLFTAFLTADFVLEAKRFNALT